MAGVRDKVLGWRCRPVSGWQRRVRVCLNCEGPEILAASWGSVAHAEREEEAFQCDFPANVMRTAISAYECARPFTCIAQKESAATLPQYYQVAEWKGESFNGNTV